MLVSAIPMGAGSAQPDSARTALGGDRGVHVRESIRLEVRVADVYRFWRHLDNLPQFMTDLDRVTERADCRSHWLTSGPAWLAVEWDASGLAEGGINQGAADAAHSEEDDELLAAGNGARKGSAKAGRR
jgi:uncharacterized membrane protein